MCTIFDFTLEYQSQRRIVNVPLRFIQYCLPSLVQLRFQCIGFMTTLKGIPSTYNKDLQEDKEALFHTYDMLYQMFHIAEKALATLKVNRNNCKNSLTSDMLATDMAYYLVRKGVSFSHLLFRCYSVKLMYSDIIHQNICLFNPDTI